MTELLQDVLDLLEECNIAYMVVGSISSSIYRQARATQDLDVVVQIEAPQLEQLLQRLPNDRYYFSSEAAAEAVRRRTSFNLVDLRGGGKINLLPLKRRAFSQTEFERRRPVQALGRLIQVAAPEDVILSKLEWNALTPSERQLRDVAGIVAAPGDRLDKAYLERWAETLGVSEELHRLLSAGG
ncbi:MAG: hypothetical protein U0931_29700 [Vulcanimicrobiota bacterium]